VNGSPLYVFQSEARAVWGVWNSTKTGFFGVLYLIFFLPLLISFTQYYYHH